MIDPIGNSSRPLSMQYGANQMQNTPSGTGADKRTDPGSTGCKSWTSRKYVDRSGDSSVSFQTPTHVAPQMAAQAVQAHEQEHVAHNAQNAQEHGKTAHSTVTVHMAVCPDWGTLYVSGGTTTTTYTDKPDTGTGAEANKGSYLDMTV